jgi:hypothetical protein
MPQLSLWVGTFMSRSCPSKQPPLTGDLAQCLRVPISRRQGAMHWLRQRYLRGRGLATSSGWPLLGGRVKNCTKLALLSHASMGGNQPSKQLTGFLVWGSFWHPTGGPKWAFKHLGVVQPSGKTDALEEDWQAPEACFKSLAVRRRRARKSSPVGIGKGLDKPGPRREEVLALWGLSIWPWTPGPLQLQEKPRWSGVNPGWAVNQVIQSPLGTLYFLVYIKDGWDHGFYALSH